MGRGLNSFFSPGYLSEVPLEPSLEASITEHAGKKIKSNDNQDFFFFPFPCLILQLTCRKPVPQPGDGYQPAGLLQSLRGQMPPAAGQQ